MGTPLCFLLVNEAKLKLLIILPSICYEVAKAHGTSPSANRRSLSYHIKFYFELFLPALRALNKARVRIKRDTFNV